MIRVFAILGLFIGWMIPLLAQGLAIDETHAGKTKVWRLHQKGAQVVGISLIFPRGENIEPSGLESLMTLHNGMLFEGSERYSAQELRNFLREHGIQISITPDLHATRLLMNAPKAHLEQALAILEEMLARPSFAPERLDLLKHQLSLGLHALSESPSYAMSRVYAKLACQNHPCGKDHTGTTQTIARITPQNIHDLHRALLNPDGLKVLVCGDIDPKSVQKITHRILGALPKPIDSAIHDKLPVAPLDELGTVHYIQHPSEHSSVFFYKKGLPFFHEDYFALMIANEILGGGNLTSRLYETTRIQQGLVYSIGQGLRPDYYNPTITGMSSCKTDNLDPLLKSIRETYAAFRKKGISDDELASTKNSLKGEFARRFQTTTGSLSSLSLILQEDCSPDYLEKRNHMIDSITKDDVLKAIQLYFDPAKLTFIVAGKKAPAHAIVETIHYPK